jgi:hypothetical protein
MLTATRLVQQTTASIVQMEPNTTIAYSGIPPPKKSTGKKHWLEALVSGKRAASGT